MLIALNILAAFVGSFAGSYIAQKFIVKKITVTSSPPQKYKGPSDQCRVVVRDDKAIRMSEIRRNDYNG